jgi:hypothetical protein
MESRREPNKGALRLPQVPSFRPPLRAGARPVRWGPDPRKRDTVLAAVKDASRRLRRWPTRGPSLTAAARGVTGLMQVGTKKRPSVEQRN